MVKCKDFYIVKVSKKRTQDLKIIYDEIQLFINFKWSVIEELTNKTEEEWQFNYMLETYECAFEEIYENHKIVIEVLRRSILFYIPKEKINEYNNLLNIIREKKLDYKILKKTQISFLNYYDERDLHLKRKRSHTYSINSKTYKIWIREKKLTRIIEEN